MDTGPSPTISLSEPAPLTGSSIVLVRNHGASILKCHYGGQAFFAAPGDQVAMPWDAAVLWFGNPTLVDRADGDEWHRFRTREAKRINTLYGMLASPFYSDVMLRTQEDSHGDPVETRNYLPLEDLEALGWVAPPGIKVAYNFRHPNLPIVTVRHTSGNQALIHMVIDDPYGAHDAVVQATIAASASNAATADMAVKMASMEAELAEMRSLVSHLQPALAPSFPTPTVTSTPAGATPAPDPTAPGQTTTINPISDDVAKVFAEERKAASTPPTPSTRKRGGSS